MKKLRSVTGVMLCAAALTISGCAQDISHTLPPEKPAVEAIATVSTTASEKVTETVTETAETTTEVSLTTAASSEDTAEPAAGSMPEDTESVQTAETTETADGGENISGEYTMYSDEYKSYPLNDAYQDFLSRCVFVGDSICSGLKAYDILPSNRVVAVGNVAARNIFEDWVEFKINGEKLSLIPALVNLKPDYIVFSMGMNDVNMTSEQAFCKNYEEILSQVESFLPESKLIVCSITPITYGESGKMFTSNENIDSFNAALKEYLDSTGKWIYADVEHELKNTHNMLKDDYLGSPDGVHLAPDAYYAILYQICERMVDGKVYNFDGSFSQTDGVRTEQTTAAEVSVTSEEEHTAELNGEFSGTLTLSDDD
ncbi:MAG: hypothetical protein IK990_08135 [Ruminiclostridium sp.]|nr:hypothetical protein [Ruminiclostridium sp.]